MKMVNMYPIFPLKLTSFAFSDILLVGCILVISSLLGSPITKHRIAGAINSHINRHYRIIAAFKQMKHSDCEKQYTFKSHFRHKFYY